MIGEIKGEPEAEKDRRKRVDEAIVRIKRAAEGRVCKDCKHWRGGCPHVLPQVDTWPEQHDGQAPACRHWAVYPIPHAPPDRHP